MVAMILLYFDTSGYMFRRWSHNIDTASIRAPLRQPQFEARYAWMQSQAKVPPDVFCGSCSRAQHLTSLDESSAHTRKSKLTNPAANFMVSVNSHCGRPEMTLDDDRKDMSQFIHVSDEMVLHGVLTHIMRIKL
jgi:hypothetical protein